MNKLIFAKRNLKDIFREPLSLVFNLLFPILMLFVFELIIGDMSEEEVLMQTPQFAINRLAPSLCAFSFSFLMLFTGMLVSKDRTTDFLARLKSSPLTCSDFIVGYVLPMIPIGFLQIVLCYGISMFFGLTLTWTLLLSIISMIPLMIMFICLGVLFGSMFNDKVVSGVCSLFISISAIFGGMFMPLDNIKGSIMYNLSYSLPFANSLKLTRCVIDNDYNNIIIPLLVVLGYLLAVVSLAILFFRHKYKGDRI